MTAATEIPLPTPNGTPGDRFFGTNPKQRDGIERLLRVALIHICCISLMGLAGMAGLVPGIRLAYMLGYFAMGWVVFYTLMRSGWSNRLADPSLDTAITVFGMSTVVVAYSLMDIVHGLALQFICIVLVMHIDRLRIRLAILITFGCVATLIAILAAQWWFTPESLNLRIEIYNLALVTLLLPIAVFLINEAHRVSTQAMQHSGTLTDTLNQLREQALQDPTTGLPNRRHMTRLMLQEIKRQGRTGQPFCLTFFEVEWPTSFDPGETQHAARDEVLRQVAQLASGSIDSADSLACWSRGRLLLMQPVTHLAGAQEVASRVLQAVREHNWARIQRSLNVTLSAGSTEHLFTDSLDVTIERAERALQRARQVGPDRLVTEPDLAQQGAARNSTLRASAPARSAYQPASSTPSTPSRKRMRPVMRVSTEHGTKPGNSPLVSDWLQRQLHRLKLLVLSTDPTIRDDLRLSLAGSVVYAVWLILLHSYALPNGLIASEFAHWLTVYDLIGMLVFYPLIRSGWSRRWQDGQLALAQMLYGCGACATCYAAAPDLRAESLQIMCFIQLFGMAALTAWQTRVIALSAIAMQCAALAWAYVTRTNEQQALLEVVTVATSCYIVARISLQSYRFSQFREKVHAEQDTLNEAVEQIRNQLMHDPLTGLLNRRYMDELLNQEAARVQRSGRNFCVALIGLDHFESTQGRYAYAASDEMLARFGPTASKVLRETDALARWSQQTFLALLPDTETGPQGVLGLERLRQHIAAQPPTDQGLRATMSCGIAEYRSGESIARLIERAERGLYTARASGNNRCVLAD
jgi:diguanylate cyclase (GGDEF)-like protein